MDNNNVNVNGENKSNKMQNNSISPAVFMASFFLTVPYAIYFFTFLYNYVSKDFSAPAYHIFIALIPFCALFIIALFTVKKNISYLLILSILIAIFSPLFLTANSARMENAIIENQGTSLHDPIDYKNMIEKYSYLNRIYFFPEEITYDMKDVSFYASTSGWTDKSTDVLLYYKTTPEHIDKIIEQLSPSAQYYIDDISVSTEDIDYVLPSLSNLDLNFNSIPDGFSCIILSSYHYTATETRRHEYESSGVAFSKDTGEVIYFYTYFRE